MILPTDGPTRGPDLHENFVWLFRKQACSRYSWAAGESAPLSEQTAIIWPWSFSLTVQHVDWICKKTLAVSLENRPVAGTNGLLVNLLPVHSRLAVIWPWSFSLTVQHVDWICKKTLAVSLENRPVAGTNGLLVNLLPVHSRLAINWP